MRQARTSLTIETGGCDLTDVTHAEFRDDRFVAAYTDTAVKVAYIVRAVAPGRYILSGGIFDRLLGLLDVERSIAFYEKYLQMKVVKRRENPVDVWLADGIRVVPPPRAVAGPRAAR